MSTISIIIPTLNRANTLKITLGSILKQSGLKEVEVIVIDNGSTDNTAKVCNDFISNTSLPVHYYYDAEPGLLTGRHRGASAASGDILCFLDDDVELTPTWLQGVRQAFNDPEVQLATGPCIPKYESTPPEWLRYFWETDSQGRQTCYWLSLIDWGNKVRVIHPNYVWGLNFCIRKEALVTLGGFHPDCIPSHLQMFQGDGETGLTMKAYDLKYKCLYHPGIKLFHIISSERLTVKYFKKRAFYQGVCNSFSELRMKDGTTMKTKLTLVRVLRKMRSLLRKFKLLRNKEDVPAEIKILRDLFSQEQTRGYDYHQQAFKNDKAVREWVQRKDYWNYKLPL